jgi:predicted amino acid racemase
VFLDVTLRRNRPLVDLAAQLHRRGAIRPNTYVLDADTVVRNARLIAATAAELGLRVNVMTKQYGRNPRVSQLVRDAGLSRFVAVDMDEARTLWHAGLEVAHVGHLVGLSRIDVPEAVLHRPSTITVYSIEQARWLSAACAGHTQRQDLLLRMYDPAQTYHPGQHGGFELADLDVALPRLFELPNVRVAGVTSHPCLDYDYAGRRIVPTGKLELLRTAADRIAMAGDGPVEVNTPGITCVASMPMCKAAGSTTVEPGSVLTGSTPLHADSDEPEAPAVVYVSEVSHRHGSRAFTFGGGFYSRGRQAHAWVAGGDSDGVVVPAAPHPPETIDYYGELIDPGGVGKVGDGVIYAFRNQIFVGRSRVAVVEGLHDRPEHVRVTGIYDSAGRLLSDP